MTPPVDDGYLGDSIFNSVDDHRRVTAGLVGIKYTVP